MHKRIPVWPSPYSIFISWRFKRSAHHRWADEETRPLVGCPRQREPRSYAGPLLNLITRKAPSRFQYTRHLASQSCLVGDVHGDGVRPDVVEGAVVERQGERIRLSDLDPVHQPATGSQDAGYFDELRREADRRHPATAFGREIAGRATEAAADLEHVHAR
jgi:hypothetical protein